MKHVVVVNGKPQAGKTTFQEMCIKYLDRTKMAHGHIISSIDYIKDVYRQLGWDGNKTDKARKDLYDLKQMWIDNCNGPISYIMKYVTGLYSAGDHVVFVDVREESEIIKFMETFNALRPIGIACTAVFIDRPDNAGIEFGNKGDDMAGSNMSIYDTIISNAGNIEWFGEQAEKFIDSLMEE